MRGHARMGRLEGWAAMARERTASAALLAVRAAIIHLDYFPIVTIILTSDREGRLPETV
jgi:hypothetical protein